MTEEPVTEETPAEEPRCLCGRPSVIVTMLSEGTQKCEHCGSQTEKQVSVALCDLHNDLRLQGRVNGNALLLAHRLAKTGGLMALEPEEQMSTADLVFGVMNPDDEGLQRVFVSDSTGVRILDEQEQARATASLRQSLTPGAAS